MSNRETITITLNPSSMDDYRTFLRVKRLPSYRVQGHTVSFPAEYADRLGIEPQKAATTRYRPIKGLFDYQRAIAKMAIEKQKFAVFADCGLGKTLILTEFARHAASVIPNGRAFLIVSPLMVVKQTMAEAKRFYGDSLPIEHVPANRLAEWLTSGTDKIGITNYDALTDATPRGRLAGLALDESSMLKSHYGKWGQTCLRLGEGLFQERGRDDE